MSMFCQCYGEMSFCKLKYSSTHKLLYPLCALSYHLWTTALHKSMFCPVLCSINRPSIYAHLHPDEAVSCALVSNTVSAQTVRADIAIMPVGSSWQPPGPQWCPQRLQPPGPALQAVWRTPAAGRFAPPLAASSLSVSTARPLSAPPARPLPSCAAGPLSAIPSTCTSSLQCCCESSPYPYYTSFLSLISGCLALLVCKTKHLPYSPDLCFSKLPTVSCAALLPQYSSPMELHVCGG